MPEGQISISEDKLYRALAEQELRIIDKVVAQIKPIEVRVTALELTNAGDNALASDLAKRADRRAMVKPTLVATAISACTAVFLHFF